MTAPHLIGIGRLGGQDDNGWHHVMIKPQYRGDFDHTDDIYLIFEEDRVFYVTISDRKERDKRILVKFAEDGVAAERKLHREAVIAIDDTAFEPEDDEALLGRDVVLDGQLLGCVVDVFFNGAQDVLVLATDLDSELMIPYVDHYVLPPRKDSDVLHLKNMEELLAASGFKLQDGILSRNENED
ncbi:MAG: hypothetical protein PHU99_03940 [Candidatus Cloacimonetes bacterium]|jgi:ribosomal 30S subunit maturation factor RimM|nr:hypothetical protein [Candidatus Cloacimonadota bacterium]MDY0337640.1 hypothetical protein [Candidatus Cloacimonadaceae bacterium]MCK9335389.1 hypothetical protein [Candidatus Cloacimonadota bacterium]MDD2544173.1 hypothetical protein [Candidatus Cloacimonadota bacterium]MDD2684199.1 hypothetical protein [Candidatus Cloacimonadota bacterium]